MLSRTKKIVVNISKKIVDYGWFIFSISVLGFLISWLFTGLLVNGYFMFSNIYDFLGIQTLRHVLSSKFNINYADPGAFRYNFIVYMRLFVQTSMVRPEIGISHLVLSFNFTWSIGLLFVLLLKAPLVLISGILYIISNILKYLLTLAAFNFFTISVTDFVNGFLVVKQVIWDIFFNLTIFLNVVLLPVYLYVRDYFTNSVLFHASSFLIQFVVILLKSFILDWIFPLAKWLGVNFLYFFGVVFNYLYDTVGFLKLCVLHSGWWRPPSTWPIILKYNLYKYLDTHIPLAIADNFLFFIYTPIMAIYYFFKFFWVEYFQYAYHFIVMTILHPFAMFNEVMVYFTFDPHIDAWTKKFKIIVADKETNFSHISQLPFRRFLRQMWFVYPFIFIYTFINSLGELIYEYCAEFQDHFFDIYEIYMENYGLLYHLFDDYFFTYFLFYFFLLIGFILEAPIYTIDFFLGKPDTDVTGVRFVFLDWLSAQPLIHIRWIHVQDYPFETYMLILLSILDNLTFVVKNTFIHYYNTLVCNEFKALYTIFFSDDKSYLKIVIVWLRELAFFSISYFLVFLNFFLNTFQVNLIFFPIAAINFIFGFIGFFIYFIISFDPLFFIGHLIYNIILTCLTLVYWLVEVMQVYWTECFSTQFINKFPILLNYLCSFLLFMVDTIKFLVFKFPLVAIFEFYFMLHTNLIINPIVDTLLSLIQFTVTENLEYFPGFDQHFVYLSRNFATLGFLPLVYINAYVGALLVLFIYLYIYLTRLFIQMILYFRLGGILMETQKLVNFAESPQARRLYYVMHFNMLDIKQSTTALAKERKSSKLVKAFYRKWFGVGHAHFMDYKWRIVSNNLRGLRKLKMQYLIKNKFRRPLIGNSFFYNPMDYVKHIRTLFLRINYSILRFYDLNKHYYSAQFRYSRSFLDGHIIPGYGQMIIRPTRFVKKIPKYGFPIFSYFRIFFGRPGTTVFSTQKRFLGTKYFFPYGFPSYLILSNLAWWVYFVTIVGLRILIKISLVSMAALIHYIYIFFIKK